MLSRQQILFKDEGRNNFNSNSVTCLKRDGSLESQLKQKKVILEPIQQSSQTIQAQSMNRTFMLGGKQSVVKRIKQKSIEPQSRESSNNLRRVTILKPINKSPGYISRSKNTIQQLARTSENIYQLNNLKGLSYNSNADSQIRIPTIQKRNKNCLAKENQ